MGDRPDNSVTLLCNALQTIRSTPPRIITSPATQPRRAAVAIIIRIVPGPDNEPLYDQPESDLTTFFSLPWVNDPRARAEILFLRRDRAEGENHIAQNKPRNGSEAHLAFPGGRTEEGDEGGLYTAMRQTWEEIGLDLAEKDFVCVGQLDDREITTSLGKRLLMILSPYVFLQVTPHTLTTEPVEGTSLHWIPISTLLASTKTAPRQNRRRWGSVTVDVASRLTPRNSFFLRLLVRILVGSMQFNAILLDDFIGEKLEKYISVQHRGWQDLKLWGLSLGMTLDLMAYMTPTSFMTDYPRDEVTGVGVDIAPSMTSVFPRFSYPDVNFWIWVFGKRYRAVVRDWQASVRAGGATNKRINWTGTALNAFYAAVRKALVVVIVLRAIGLLIALGIGAWWSFFT